MLKQKKRLTKVKEIQQKLNDDPSEFLERIYQVYQKYTNDDPETLENLRMVNVTSLDQVPLI